jgi:hypothetical protein
MQDLELQGSHLYYSYATTATVATPRRCFLSSKERNQTKEDMEKKKLLTRIIVVNIHSLSEPNHGAGSL